MKIVTINDTKYRVIEDTDDLNRLKDLIVDIYEMDGEPKNEKIKIQMQGAIKFIDDIRQIHGTWGSLALIPEVDDFEIAFGSYPNVLSETRFKRLCEKYEIDPRTLNSVSMDIYTAMKTY